MSDESPVEAAPRSGRRWWIALVTVALLVGYPLSVGPIAFLADRYPKAFSMVDPVWELI